MQPPIAFEVASVKPNPSRDAPERISLQPNGDLRFTGFHFRTLITIAYGSLTIQRFDQFIGGPAWIADDRFDIVAKAGGDISADAQGRRSDRLIAMRRTLLEDRFHVRVHAETRPMDAFLLQGLRGLTEDLLSGAALSQPGCHQLHNADDRRQEGLAIVGHQAIALDDARLGGR